MRVVLLGPPGAGKGTQAERISARFEVAHLGTGDLLRAAAERGTPLGRKARGYMERGDLVPDELIVDLVLERLAADELAGGFVLDGFPRTVAQAEALDRRLAELDRRLDAVIALEVGEAELRRRLAARADQQDRAEDEDERAVDRRLELFADEAGPLAAYYDRRGLLVRVDGEGGEDEVAERVAAALAAAGGGGRARTAGGAPLAGEAG